MKQLRSKALKKFLEKIERPKIEMIFLLQDVEDPVNVGSAFRIADACGVKRIILTGISARPPHLLISKVGRGLDRRVRWDYVKNGSDAITDLKNSGFTCCALELATNAKPYHEIEYPDKICLVVGHEDHGVVKEVLQLCNMPIFLPMYGEGESMNVHVSLAIAAYHILHSPF